MSGVTTITEKITAEAVEAAERIRLNAERDADAVLDEARRNAATLRADLLKKAEADAAAVVQRVESQVESAQRSANLAARRRVLDEAFASSESRLCDLPDELTTEFCAKLAAEYRSGDAELVMNRRDSGQIGQAVVDRALALSPDKPFSLCLSETPGEFSGGFILRQGNIETNCTYAVLVGGMRDSLEGDVAAILFG